MTFFLTKNLHLISVSSVSELKAETADFPADGLTVFQVSVLLFILTVINVKIVQVVQMGAGSVSHLLD